MPILKYFHEYFPLLPRDSKTLPGTPSNIETKIIKPGKYFHISILSNLEQFYCKCKDVPDSISLICNTDGLPVLRTVITVPDSSNNCFRVLLGKFRDDKVFLIGIFQGTNKPNDFNESLDPFVEECLNLQNELVINEKHVINMLLLYVINVLPLLFSDVLRYRIK